MAVARSLADAGLRVTLLESRPRLGGRAGSFEDRSSGETIDNCQHVAMGCCTNYLHFCETLGIDHLLERQRELHFVDRDGAFNRFRPWHWLPSPVHLIPALRQLKFLTRADRAHIAKTFRSIAAMSRTREPLQVSEKFLSDMKISREQLEASRQSTRDKLSFLDFLNLHRPSENVKRRFWNVILVSALSESLENISFQHAAKVFVDGFLANNRGWEIWIPSVSLGELYDSVPPAEIVGQEGSLRLLTGVEKILEGSDGTIRAVKTRQGEELEADQFVLAVPWYRLPELLPARLQLKYASVKEIQPAPISSVHLWFDRPVTELPHAVFVDHLSQWIFARPAKANRIDGNDTSYYQIVISESRALGKVSKDEVIDRVLEEIRSVFPRARAAQLVHSRLVTEHKAVFSPRPGIESLRPSQTTPVENLHLAGDWTDTGWPATMEGAVRSGYLAAESVLAALGIDHQILQPSLPATWLARRLFGLPKS